MPRTYESRDDNQNLSHSAVGKMFHVKAVDVLNMIRRGALSQPITIQEVNDVIEEMQQFTSWKEWYDHLRKGSNRGRKSNDYDYKNAEVAKRIGVSPGRVSQMIREGRLPRGLPREEVDTLIESGIVKRTRR